MDLDVNFVGESIVGRLANKVGASEPAIRLLLTVFAGYPIAAFHRCLLLRLSSKTVHHLYFAVSGCWLCYFNYGQDTCHSIIAILMTYLSMRLFAPSPNYLIASNFIFHMGYLLIGYYYTESAGYDILWTMPHCILALRMIGFSFDVADGRKSREQMSKEQVENNVTHLPSLLQLFAYAYFPLAFIVGPQFPYRRYQRFINGEFKQYSGSIKAGLLRMSLGLLYLAVRQVGAGWLPDDYFLEQSFANRNFVLRLLLLGIWAKLALYKYISCWLLTEGALMCIGFSYAGNNADGSADWSGCSNVKLALLETGNTMYDYVLSFNVNTNNWVAQYVYKRLKFMNNRTISYAAALSFLAVWHGFHSGYYMSFFIEYMIVTTEKQIETFYEKQLLPKYAQVLNSTLGQYCKMAVLKLYHLIYMGWCMTPFILLSYERWSTVFAAVNYFGFIYVLSWFVFNLLYKFLVTPAPKDKQN